MVTLTIDERKLQGEKGATVLDVARNNNIYIPTLCFNEAVAAFGACRLCMVEITSSGRRRLVASCLYPIEEGLVVSTGNERIVNNRQMIMELLLGRCPNNKAVQELARRLGVEKTSFKLEDNQCVLCALCTRVCHEVVGANAISLVNRGVKREVATPFYEPSSTCIGCGSCAYVCPVSAIRYEDVGDTRRIDWPTSSMEFKLKKCNTCGSYWAPEKQLDYITKKSNLAGDAFDNCPDCRS